MKKIFNILLKLLSFMLKCRNKNVIVNVPPIFFSKSGTGGSPFQLAVVISCCDWHPFITIKNNFHRLAFLFKNKIFLQLRIGYISRRSIKNLIDSYFST
jgi:hypothetical protein